METLSGQVAFLSLPELSVRVSPAERFFFEGRRDSLAQQGVKLTVQRSYRIAFFVLRSVKIFSHREDFGPRLSPAAAGPTAGCRDELGAPFPSADALQLRTAALLWLRLRRAVFACGWSD